MPIDTSGHKQGIASDEIPERLAVYARRGDCVFIIGEDQRLGGLADVLARERNFDEGRLSFLQRLSSIDGSMQRLQLLKPTRNKVTRFHLA